MTRNRVWLSGYERNQNCRCYEYSTGAYLQDRGDRLARDISRRTIDEEESLSLQRESGRGSDVTITAAALEPSENYAEADQGQTNGAH